MIIVQLACILNRILSGAGSIRSPVPRTVGGARSVHGRAFDRDKGKYLYQQRVKMDFRSVYSS